MIKKLKQNLAIRRSAKDIVRLYSDEVSEKSQHKISQWSNSSEDYREHFVGINRMISNLEKFENNEALSVFIEPSNAKKRPSKIDNLTARKFQWPGLVIATILLAVVFLFTMEMSPDTGLNQGGDRYVTRIGEQKSIVLEDGTSVFLNTNTELVVRLDDAQRMLTLIRGEAFFDVSKDAERVFSVNAGGQAVTVLGTAFNLHRAPDRLTLSVSEGEVVLHKFNEPIVASQLLEIADSNDRQLQISKQYRLGPGYQVNVDSKYALMTASAVDDVNHIASWRKGIIRFSESRLSDVVRELNRYSAKKIYIEDADLMDMKLYATVRIDRIDETLQGLELSMPIRVISFVDRVIITKKNNQQ